MQHNTGSHTANHYHPVSISLHWLTLALIVAVYVLIELRELYPKGSDPRETMKQWHAMLGLTVFSLLFVRVVVLRLFRAPPITPEPLAWRSRLAIGVHLVLYIFLIAMPLLGWLVLSAKGKPVPFWGLELPSLVAPDKTLAHDTEEIHKLIGTLGYYLIGLHAAAGLYYHYVVGDDTLRRMLPRWGQRHRNKQINSVNGR
jgi:cytochrome b561